MTSATLSAQELVSLQRRFFRTGQTKSLPYRIEALKRLRRGIEDYQTRILAALRADLNKSEAEGFHTEIRLVLGELDYTLEHLEEWAAPRVVPTSSQIPDGVSRIHPEPYGVTLVIAPWNYPFQLAFSPLVGAISAGNTAVLKPSELTPNVSKISAQLIAECFPQEFVAAMEGEVETSTELLREKFDYIFFTGSTPVGKVVMRAAAEHLTPTTLELGGKSPSIVHLDADLKKTAQSLVRGKFLNAGQTCVAPDYLLVHEDVREALVQEIKLEIADKHGEDVLSNPDFPHIVNERNFDRLSRFLQDGKALIGGRSVREQLLIEPTLLEGIDWESPVMQEEIFGPILPMMTYTDLDDVLEKIVDRPKPLALYLFTRDQEVQNLVLNTVSFGGGCVNETLLHMSSHELPFGGVGESGMGSYHGRQSFETFSHHKSMLVRGV
ncbi:aldehyde dehydrogenase family protein [Saccharibacillus sp. O23]|uniref:aldehyde dehydrogenase n=1 Tax=Saccharibacillus sp. O23 TaxID=2009338 RepID=UPI000B4E7A05|nr:aldehyde dehydrogenase [Saccharibacillus sp. O23]OWR32546.1 aldehyde dehydrogenase family protein [Saccharibacillus sp. O23]